MDGCDLTSYLRGDTTTHRRNSSPSTIHNNPLEWRRTAKARQYLARRRLELIYEYESGATQLYNLADDLSETNDSRLPEIQARHGMTRALTPRPGAAGALCRATHKCVPVPPVDAEPPAVLRSGWAGRPCENPNRMACGIQGENRSDDPERTMIAHPTGRNSARHRNPLNPLHFVAFPGGTNGEPRELSWAG